MRLMLLLHFLLAAVLTGSTAAKGQTLPQEIEINGVEFVLIPAGEFWYTVETGRPSEIPSGQALYRDVRIALDDFYIAKFQARARDLQRFLNSGQAKTGEQYGGRSDGCAVRLDDKGNYYLLEPDKDMPATQLSWDLALEFASWMGFRLPSEAEWEKAARGTDKRFWPWGNQYPDDTIAGYFSNPRCTPTPVDAFPKGRSPYGVYDMAGNVYDWVADWYNAERDAALKDGDRNPPLATEGTTHRDIFDPVKILKGGRWASHPSELTIFARSLDLPTTAFLCYGARFAIDAAEVRKRLETGNVTIVTR